MLPDRVSNPGPLTYESGALPIALRGPARSLTEKIKFSTSFLLKSCNNLVYSSASAVETETQLFPQPFCVKFDAFSAFTGYVFGWKHSLQLIK